MTIEGPFAAALAEEDPEDNLVMRAARRLHALIDAPPPPAILLDKRLPVAAGIGGGSADAAAALRLLCRGLKIAADDPRVLEIATALGADVPACLLSATVRGDGRGDALVRLEATGLSGLPLLLVNPRAALATGPVFRAWDGIDRGPLITGDALAVAQAGRNDLQPPAIALCPAIGEVLAALHRQKGVILARMSGSGATCFALFEREASRDAAEWEIAQAHPAWWRLASRIR